MKSNRPYVQLDPAMIEQAQQTDLFSYLKGYEPENLEHGGLENNGGKCGV